MRALIGVAVVGIALTAGTADAASVLQVRSGTGSPTMVGPANDYPFLATPAAVTRNGVLETTGAGTLTFEYLGHEAGWVNTFLVEGKDCFRTGSSKVGATCSASTSGGVIDFQFRASPRGPEVGAAVWSNRAPPRSVQSYSVGLVQEAPNTFLILWNSGVHDGDYDDLGVRVVFQPARPRQRERQGAMLAGVVGAGRVRLAPYTRGLRGSGRAVEGVRGCGAPDARADFRCPLVSASVGRSGARHAG